MTEMTLPIMESHVLASATWHRVTHRDIDPDILRPFLGFRPKKRVEKMLEKTTQLAKMTIRNQLRHHIKPRNPHMNVTRIDEPVSTDPMFTNCRSIYHGYMAAQVSFGTKSHTIIMCGIKSKAEFPRVYRDFIRDQGAPSALRRDNAKEEQSKLVKDINREFMIKDQYTEPHHPQQNPVKSSAIRYIRNQVMIVLDQTGAPDLLRYMAALYIADIHNICFDKNLPNEMTPLQYLRGVTPDISVHLQFIFYQPVLFLDHEGDWPSSNERSGRWVGIAHGIGDILTFWILDDQSKYILAQSVVCPFTKNLRVKWDPTLAEHPMVNKSKKKVKEYVNQGVDTINLAVPKVNKPLTRAQRRLQIHSEVIPVDESIESFTRTKKVPYKQVEYKKKFIPPELKDPTPGVRRSERLTPVTTCPTTRWTASKARQAMTINVGS